MIKIVIFASGSGSNAENIIQYFQENKEVNVTYVVSNKKNAKVLERAKNLNVPTWTFDRDALENSITVLSFLKEHADFIVLAGFLLKMPVTIIAAFPNKIINIHPALLPKYGGKGMYGARLHEEVKKNNEAETGITIHYVNENYDEGAIIFQKTVALSEVDTPETIAEKVHELEYEHYPKVIENLMSNQM